MATKRFILMLLVMLGSVTGAWAETVSYIDVDGTSKSVNATVITRTSSTLNAGWYVVKGTDVQTRCLTCNGAVKLILADGAKLTATGGNGTPDDDQLYPGIKVSGTGTSLTIYGQTGQSGILIATGGHENAGIDGNNITINGGNVIATGGYDGAGIGGGKYGEGNNITINGGTVTAKGGKSGAGIGGGIDGNGSKITINGGCVTATGGENGAGIGGGDEGSGNNITINGGTVNANGGGFSAAIGGGRYSNGSHISITGGRIIANGHFGGIGGGYQGHGEYITITGGDIFASTDDGDAIGNGYYGTGSNNIFVDSSLNLYADNNNPPNTEISHTSETDMAEVLFGRKYAIIDIHKYAESREEGAAYYTCSFCGRIDPVRQHVHNYSEEWSIDGTRHWHQCTSEVGTCTAPRADEAEHVYDKTSLDDTEAYYCSVCGYLDEEVKAQYEARDYMSMTAVGGDVTIGTTTGESSPTYVMQYSLDRTHWTNYETKNPGEIITLHEGETCYFRTASPTVQTSTIDYYYDSYVKCYFPDDWWNFTMSGSGTIEAGGNTMSLIDQTCQSLTAGIFCFFGLFDRCAQLTVAPELPATTLGDNCYSAMFADCINLRKAPHLPATALPYECYSEMFWGCTSLNYVEADFTQLTYLKENTKNWLKDTAAEGNLVLKRSMLGTYVGELNLPTGWKKAVKIKANEDPDHKGKFYTTLFDYHPYDITDDFKAYTGVIASGDDGDELQLISLKSLEYNAIPSSTGVIICSNTPDVVLPLYAGSTGTVEGNVLTGSYTETTAPANCYILSYGQHGLGFYQYAEGKTLSAHKAYLTYQRPAGAPAKALRMVFADDEVDGIESISSDSANSPTGIFSVSGVRLNKLQKGINIVNGKKIVVK